MPVTTASEMDNTLFEGYQQLSGKQTVTFTKYVKRILPADGFVFWVKASLIETEIGPFAKVFEGTLHQSVNQTQEATKTNAITSIILTVNKPIEELKEVNSQVLWLGEYKGSKFSFNIQNAFYDNANQYHYAGDAVYIENYPAIIDDLLDLDLTNQVISDSTIFWLLLDLPFTVYPSFLVPTNIKPPYAVVEIDQQKPLNARPVYDDTQTSSSHIGERAIITLYGLRHNAAVDLIEAVDLSHFIDGYFGIMNIPIVKDEKIPQSEINVITQKKVIEFYINYEQKRLRDVALKLVENINVNLTARF